METPGFSFFTDHWAFFVVSLLLGILGEVLKRFILPDKHTTPPKGWRAFYHATLPLHPALAGAVVGMIPGFPCPETYCTSMYARALYYGAAGMLSSYVYSGVKHMAASKFGASISAD